MVTVLSCQPVCQPGAGEERITGDDIAQGRGLRVIRTAVGASDDLVSCGRLTSRGYGPGGLRLSRDVISSWYAQNVTGR